MPNNVEGRDRPFPLNKANNTKLYMKNICLYYENCPSVKAFCSLLLTNVILISRVFF